MVLTQIRLLGPPSLSVDGIQVESFSGKLVALVAFLATQNVPQNREMVASLLWPELNQSKAQAALRTLLWRLKKQVSTDWLEVRPRTVELRKGEQIWVDYHCLHELLERCRQHGHNFDIPYQTKRKASTATCEQCSFILEEMIGLFQGNFLEGFTLKDSLPFDNWQSAQTEELRKIQSGLLADYIDCLQENGRYEQAIRYAQHWLALDQLQEEPHRVLMLLYEKIGDRVAAIRQYHECIHLLQSELSIRPDDQTTQVYLSILRSSQIPDLERGMQSLRSVQFKTLVEAEKKSAPNLLPTQPNPFLGREEELSEIKRLLNNPTCRILTLVGPGGVGKTRLAVQAAIEILYDAASSLATVFQDGIYYVPLVSIREPELLAPTIANFLRFTLTGKEPFSLQLGRFLKSKKALLLLDNFEHLTSEATLISAISQYTPTVKFLITSRERLNLRGEWSLSVPGLAFPQRVDIPDFERYSAVQLFLQTAQHINPRFRIEETDRPALIDIFKVLDGMPLGIEMSAAGTRLLTVQEIAEEIGHTLDFLSTSTIDTPSRQHNLRVVFNSSWALLNEEEKSLLRKLSLFAGSFRREAATQITGAQVHTLSNLVDKSMLQRPYFGRYQIPEVLKFYVLEKMESEVQEREETRLAFCAYFSDFLKKRMQSLGSQKQKNALDEIGHELDDLRLAWKWACELGLWEEVSQMIDPLNRYYSIRGWFQEGQRIMTTVIEKMQIDPSIFEVKAAIKARIFCRALRYQSRFSYNLGYHHEAQVQGEISLDIAYRISLPAEIGACLNNLGLIAAAQGNYQASQRLQTESLQVLRASGDLFGIASTLLSLGHVAETPEKSIEIYREALSLWEEIGDHWGIAACLISLSDAYANERNYSEAKKISIEALEISKILGARHGIASTLMNLAEAEIMLREYDSARRHLEDCLEIYTELGNRGEIALCQAYLSMVAQAMQQKEKARLYLIQALQSISEHNLIVPVALDILAGVSAFFMYTSRPVIAYSLAHWISLQKGLRIKARNLTAQVMEQTRQTKLDSSQDLAEEEMKKLHDIKTVLERVLILIHQEEMTNHPQAD